MFFKSLLTTRSQKCLINNAQMGENGTVLDISYNAYLRYI